MLLVNSSNPPSDLPQPSPMKVADILPVEQEGAGGWRDRQIQHPKQRRLAGSAWADEPVSSVDPALAAGIVKLLIDLSETHRKTLLMNLHSVDLALAHFPRVIGLKDGKASFDLPAAEVTDEHLAALYAGNQTLPAKEETPSRAEHRSLCSCQPHLTS